MDIKMFYNMRINLSPEEESALATVGDIIERIEALINNIDSANFSTFFSEYYENDMVEFITDLKNNKDKLRGLILEYLL